MFNHKRRLLLFSALLTPISLFYFRGSTWFTRNEDLNENILIFNIDRITNLYPGETGSRYQIENNYSDTLDTWEYLKLKEWLSNTNTLQLGAKQLRKILLDKINEDFKNEKVCCVNGWWLSKTESFILKLINNYS